MKWRWLAALAPAILAGVIWWMLRQGWAIWFGAPQDYANPNITLQAKATLGNWLLVMGFLLALLLLAFNAIWHWRDRVALSTLQRQRTQASEERRRLVQRLDHELKNPLTAMRAALANLLATVNGSEQEATLRSLEGQTLRLSRLTADLRKLSELEARPLERSAVEIGALLQEAFELIEEKPEATQRQLTLTIPRAPWPLSTIQGDRDLLFLAVYNLFDNALKFSRPNDAIEVRAREEGGAVLIEVADTGPGIEAEELPHIWEELYRGNHARSTPGSGLGLALVRAIVQRHHGHINIKSRAGQGTVVTLRLPVR